MINLKKMWTLFYTGGSSIIWSPSNLIIIQEIYEKLKIIYLVNPNPNPSSLVHAIWSTHFRWRSKAASVCIEIFWRFLNPSLWWIMPENRLTTEEFKCGLGRRLRRRGSLVSKSLKKLPWKKSLWIEELVMKFLEPSVCSTFPRAGIAFLRMCSMLLSIPASRTNPRVKVTGYMHCQVALSSH